MVTAAAAAAGVGDRAFSAGGDFDFIQQRMNSTLEENAQVLVTADTCLPRI